MTDSGILNAASFDDIERIHVIDVQPFIREGGADMDLGGPSNIFWIKQIRWRYWYEDVGMPNAVVKPPSPIEVTVSTPLEMILHKTTRALPPFIEPKPAPGSVSFRVLNTNLENNHKLKVEFRLQGVLVTPRDGHETLPLKVQKGYVMMSSTDRGRLAMEEAQMDRLEETFAQLGMGSLREAIPGGLSALKALPEGIQNAVLGGLATRGLIPQLEGPQALGLGAPPQQPKALPDADPQRESSAFIGDLLAACPDDLDISKQHLRAIAEQMVEKGWRKV